MMGLKRESRKRKDEEQRARRDPRMCTESERAMKEVSLFPEGRKEGKLQQRGKANVQEQGEALSADGPQDEPSWLGKRTLWSLDL